MGAQARRASRLRAQERAAAERQRQAAAEQLAYDREHGEGAWQAKRDEEARQRAAYNRKRYEAKHGRSPATTEGAATDEPCETCPLRDRNPCDVDELTVEASTSDKTRKLTTDRRKVHDDVDDVPWSGIRELLEKYDLVIEMIADPNPALLKVKRGGQSQAWKPAKIKGDAKYHGLKCVEHAHAVLEMRAQGGAGGSAKKGDALQKSPGAATLSVPPAEYFATFLPHLDDATADNSPLDQVMSIFQIVSALWDYVVPKKVEIWALACGIRAREDRTPANKLLMGLVRLHRNSKFSVAVSIPAGSSWTRSYSGNLVEETDDTHDEDAFVNPFRGGKWEGSHSVLGAERTKLADGQIDNISYDRLRDQVFKGASSITITVTHNNQKVELVKALENILKFLEALYQSINRISELFQMVPQLGFKFTFNVSFLAGGFIIEWFPVYEDAALANGRYLPVETRVRGEVKMDVVKASISVSFGFDTGGRKRRSKRDASRAPAGKKKRHREELARLYVKIEGTISADAGINTTFTNESPGDAGGSKADNHKSIRVTSNATFTFTASGYASVLGKTLGEIEAKITTGIGLCDYDMPVLDAGTKMEKLNKGGELVYWDHQGLSFDLRAKLMLERTTFKFTVRLSWLWDWESDPYEICGSRELYSFGPDT